MQCFRLAGLALMAGLVSVASANWTMTILHPTGMRSSEGFGATGNRQIGSSVTTGGSSRAGFWSATSASWVNLHPSGVTESYGYDGAGTKQGGFVIVSGKPRAALWSGTAASYVSLHPASATESFVVGMDTSKQVGYTVIADIERACIWSGTAASFVDLHPASAVQSIARNVLGNKQVGYSVFGGDSQAGMWSGSAGTWVNLHPAGASESIANTLTATRQGGYAMFGGIPHAGLWSGAPNTFVDLHPAGRNESYVWDMTDTYQVGYTKITDGFRAAIWEGTAASFVDLHAQLPTGYSQSVCHGISSDGQFIYISGVVLDDATDEFRAVVWKKAISGEPEFTFSMNKTTVAGQNSVQGTVTLSGASASSLAYTTYDNSSLVNTPASVTVPAGTTVKHFQITVVAVNSPINTTVYCRRGTVTQSKPLTLAPLVPTAIAFTPSTVVGGNSVSARVVINGVAGPGGRTIAIFDDSPYTTVPSTVNVPPGATQVIFNITTVPVTSLKTVKLTARVSAGEKIATYRVSP